LKVNHLCAVRDSRLGFEGENWVKLYK